MRFTISRSIKIFPLLCDLQKSCRFLILLKDDEEVMILSQMEEIPDSLILTSTNTIGPNDAVYHFKNDKHQYVAFSRQAAALIQPKVAPVVEPILEDVASDDDYIILNTIHGVLKFPKSNKIIEVTTIPVFDI
jgi:hypothetical protein